MIAPLLLIFQILLKNIEFYCQKKDSTVSRAAFLFPEKVPTDEHSDCNDHADGEGDDLDLFDLLVGERGVALGFEGFFTAGALRHMVEDLRPAVRAEHGVLLEILLSFRLAIFIYRCLFVFHGFPR